MQLSFGTEPRKLYRADSPETSKEAAEKLNSTKLEKLVYESIKAAGSHGCTASDLLSQHSKMPYSSITARFKALADKGFITFNGTRPGPSGRSQRVMVAVTGPGVFP